MSIQNALLSLLQIADSAFPVGGYAHSSGLEQLVRDGVVASAADVERYVQSLILHSTATSDAVVAATCAIAAADGDIARVTAADRALFAMKSSSELRHGSTSMGLRLLREVLAHVHEPVLAALLAEVQSGAAPGTYAAAFGAVAGAFGVSAEAAAGALMHTSATSILQAAMRLLAVSHRDVQGALHRLRPMIERCSVRAAASSIDDLRSFHPSQDLASARHTGARVRLFAS